MSMNDAQLQQAEEVWQRMKAAASTIKNAKARMADEAERLFHARADFAQTRDELKALNFTDQGGKLLPTIDPREESLGQWPEGAA